MKITKTAFGNQGLMIIMEEPGINLLLYPDTEGRALPIMWSDTKPWKWKVEGVINQEFINTHLGPDHDRFSTQTDATRLSPYGEGIGKAIKMATAL